MLPDLKINEGVDGSTEASAICFLKDCSLLSCCQFGMRNEARNSSISSLTLAESFGCSLGGPDPLAAPPLLAGFYRFKIVLSH